MIDSLVEAVRAAAASGKALRIRGGGTKDFYGQSLAGTVLDTRSHAGITSYAPSELVFSARAGTPLAEVAEALEQRGQFLPFEPPEFASGTTLGGVVASGLSGPGRSARGAVRDFILGAHLLDGQGQVLRFGGQVMKNVAGFDVSRVLAGSLGTLGVILEVSLKVLPRPAVSTTLRIDLSARAALLKMSDWRALPAPITASAWVGEVLTVRLSGSSASVAAGAARLGGAVVEADEANAFWEDLRDHRAPFFKDPRPLWRLALPASTTALGLSGSECYEWLGSLRWLSSELPGAQVRARAAELGGHATLFRAAPEVKAQAGVFTRPSPTQAAIEARLKKAFDPHGIFNRGRVDAV
jgi:glycolate oxidase FAD binding subunit